MFDISSYDPNPLQTALDIFAQKDDAKLRAHFDGMASIEKEMFETQLMDNLYENADFTSWYLENCASMSFAVMLAVLIKNLIPKRGE